MGPPGALLEAPLELIAVQAFVAVAIHSAEDDSQATDSVGASCTQLFANFIEDGIWRFSRHSKDGVYVGVVARALNSEGISELLVAQGSGSIRICCSDDLLQYMGQLCNVITVVALVNAQLHMLEIIQRFGKCLPIASTNWIYM